MSCLQKMKSIKYLIVNSFDSFESIHNRELLLQLMINKCLNIESIKMDFYLIRDELLVLFGHKFGKKLLNIHFNNGFETSKLA